MERVSSRSGASSFRENDFCCPSSNGKERPSGSVKPQPVSRRTGVSAGYHFARQASAAGGASAGGPASGGVAASASRDRRHSPQARAKKETGITRASSHRGVWRVVSIGRGDERSAAAKTRRGMVGPPPPSIHPPQEGS